MRKKHGEATNDEPVEMSGAVLILPGSPLPSTAAAVTAFTPVTAPAPVTAPLVAAPLVASSVGSPLATLPAPTGAPVLVAPVAPVALAAPDATGAPADYVPQHRASRRGGGSRSRLAVLALGTIALGGGAYYYLTAILPTMTG